MPTNVSLDDKKAIVKIVEDLAATAPVPPYRFFRNLIQNTELPPQMRIALANIGQASPDVDAMDLVEYARARDVNPVNTKYTVLGSFLKTLIDSDGAGLESRRTLAVIVVAKGLYRDDAALIELMTQFNIPRPAMPVQATAADAGKTNLSLPLAQGPPPSVGPDIVWRGTDPQKDPDLVLQAWPWSKPDYLDVGFLLRATDRAAAVCRIEVPSKKRTGTGFLIAPDLLLTNYHVLCYNQGEDINETAKEATLRFGYLTTATGGQAEGQAFKLVENPILSSSPVPKLDYVLVKVQSEIMNAEGIKPITDIATSPTGDKALNIIQHPEGDTLKIALDSNGIDGIYEDTGLIQYLSRAAGGSSGSPCFNDQWQLIALHHAERAKSIGSIREGILFSSIHKEIANFLPK